MIILILVSRLQQICSAEELIPDTIRRVGHPHHRILLRCEGVVDVRGASHVQHLDSYMATHQRNLGVRARDCHDNTLWKRNIKLKTYVWLETITL